MQADIFHELNWSINHLHLQVSEALANQLNSTEIIFQQLSQNISALEYRAELLNLNSGLFLALPASSCAALLPTTPSGYYWVSASNGSAVHVYCDMTRSCGGVTGGWVRVGYQLDMTNSSHQCPSGFTEHNDSNIRTCRRTDTSAGCWSLMMDVPYSRVCGRVRAYQVGSTNAFRFRETAGIDNTYVDGVSLTHGRPSQHIWTFAAGLQENTGNRHHHHYVPVISCKTHNCHPLSEMTIFVSQGLNFLTSIYYN